MKQYAMLMASAALLSVAVSPACAQDQSSPSEALNAGKTTAAPAPGATEPAAAGAASSAPNEIIVTALKRSESSQKVAATVSLIDASTIQDKGVTSITDISTVAPSVNISSAPNPGAFSLTIRGLGSEPGNPSFDSSVSTFIDGVYMSRAREFSASMFDVANIQIVKGTQAALLGKNTSLGAVNLITRKPGHDWSANMLYTHEFEYGSDRIEGGVDIPVSDNFRVRLSGFHDSTGGFIYNTVSGDYGQRSKSNGGRIVAVYEPASNLDVTAVYQASNLDTYGANSEFVQSTGFPEILTNLAGYPGAFDPDLNYRTSSYSTTYGEDYGKQSAQLASLTINLHLGGSTLTSQTAYTTSKVYSFSNTSFVAGDYGYRFIDDQSKQFTQELRLTSPEDKPISYIVGGLFLRSHYDNDTTINANTIGVPPVTGTSLTKFYQTTEAWSGFGQLDAKLAAGLKASFGLRYTNESKSVDFARNVLQPGIYSIVVTPPYAPFTLSRDEGNVDASFGLSYQVTPEVMIYGSVGQGTKAGGFAQAASLLDQSEYESERARTAELGFKSQLFDRRLTINAAAFFTKVKNFQLVTFTGTNFDVDNTDLRTYGIESTVAYAPTRTLSFYWNNTWANAKDTRFDTLTTHAPRWAGAVGASYKPDLSEGVRLATSVDFAYRSSEVGQRNQAGVVPIPASQRLNASIGLEGTGPVGWSIRLVGKNLNNEKNFGFVFPAPLEPVGNVVAIPLAPRTIAIQLGVKY